MDFLASLGQWFSDPGTWQGPGGIPSRVQEHLVLSAVPLAIAVLVALPLGVLIGHTGRGATIAINAANIGRALPSLAIIVGVLPFALRAGLGLGFWPTVVALTVLAIPPIVTNSYAGIQAVDREVIDAGRGIGMTEWHVTMGIELPLALPVILAGIRLAAVQVVATATLAAVVAGGGLGRYIIDGIARRDHPEVFAGALLVVGLALSTELVFAGLQRLAVSPGVAAQLPVVRPAPR